MRNDKEGHRYLLKISAISSIDKLIEFIAEEKVNLTEETGLRMYIFLSGEASSGRNTQQRVPQFSYIARHYLHETVLCC